jgi:TldD protein
VKHFAVWRLAPGFAALAIAALLAASARPLAAAQEGATPDQQIPAQELSYTGDKDQTLHAMHDEMERSKARLALPDADKPYYIEFRLLDLDVRSVTASFGSVISSGVQRNRFMSVDVRVGGYHLDSSNFLSEDGFQGFLGSTGQVGIDHDYHSLRQDLWLATDQAYKAALTQMSLKQAFLRSLTKPPEIDDYSQVPPLVKIDARMEPDWTSRDWDVEARTASEGLKNYPQLYGTRVNYYIIYATTYLMTSEGTAIRSSRSIAAIEAAADTEADDGMPLHDYYATYAAKAADLPSADAVAKALAEAGSELTDIRTSTLVPDYDGPVLFDAPAASAALAQILEPSLSGSRPPLSMTQDYDTFMERFGGHSDWSGRIGTRVLPADVSLIDDPTLNNFNGQPLLGNYDVDDEGVKAQRVAIVENGILKNVLMSRRPGPDFISSNGHARSALLSAPQALSSNLFFKASDAVKAVDLKKKFIDACKDDGHQWCIEIKKMDNPAIAAIHSEDFSDFVAELSGGIGSGERMPLVMYQVYVSDGHEVPVRGGIIQGLTLRSIRNMLAVGDDPCVYSFMLNASQGLASTALGAFGSVQDGIPSSLVAPSILLDDIEIRGFHGEPRRLPLVAAPPLK